MYALRRIAWTLFFSVLSLGIPVALLFWLVPARYVFLGVGGSVLAVIASALKQGPVFQFFRGCVLLIGFTTFFVAGRDLFLGPLLGVSPFLAWPLSVLGGVAIGLVVIAVGDIVGKVLLERYTRAHGQGFIVAERARANSSAPTDR